MGKQLIETNKTKRQNKEYSELQKKYSKLLMKYYVIKQNKNSII